MPQWTFQSNMNRGELDPLLVGRIDLQAYYNGVSLAQNVLSIPQGGLKKRPGQEFLGVALGDGRVENFSFNTEQNYLLVFTDQKAQVYKEGVLQTNINGSGEDFFDTPWALSILDDIDYIQTADTVIITHPDVAPQSITRSSDTAWAVAALPLLNIPQFDFNDGSSPTPVDEIQTITVAGMEQGSTVKLGLEGILTEDFSYEGANSDMAESIREQLQSLPNTGATGISVVFASGTEFDADFTVTFSGASAKDWRLVTGFMVQGLITGDEVITAARVQAGASRAEDTWSADRGWQTTCTFHEGRLWFGGAKQRPSTVFGSVVGEFFNFDVGRGLDDRAIEATLDTDQVNSVEAIFSNRSLQVFTSGGEFYAPSSPLTPSNVSFIPQSNLGSRRVRPVTIDGVTLFAQRTGKAIIQFVFVRDFQANQSRSVSILAAHLINTPKQMTVARGTESTDANYVYIVNGDGNITVFNTLATEDVAGFTRWETSGDIKSAAVVDSQLNLLVERVIDSSTVYYIERENTDLNTDSSVIGTGLASDTLTGLDHLEGETVKVKADGAVQSDEVVVGGEITIEREADTIEAGLEYLPVITTMPLNVNLQNGPNASSKKKIARVSLQLFESNGVIVNGERIADKTIGQDQFDAPEPQTGVVRMFILGWSLEADVTITQDTPMPMTILNLGMEVKI
jgi:hypothetical protein